MHHAKDLLWPRGRRGGIPRRKGSAVSAASAGNRSFEEDRIRIAELEARLLEQGVARHATRPRAACPPCCCLPRAAHAHVLTSTFLVWQASSEVAPPLYAALHGAVSISGLEIDGLINDAPSFECAFPPA